VDVDRPWSEVTIASVGMIARELARLLGWGIAEDPGEFSAMLSKAKKDFAAHKENFAVALCGKTWRVWSGQRPLIIWATGV